MYIGNFCFVLAKKPVTETWYALATFPDMAQIEIVLAGRGQSYKTFYGRNLRIWLLPYPQIRLERTNTLAYY